jgi:hypothetical protein
MIIALRDHSCTRWMGCWLYLVCKLHEFWTKMRASVRDRSPVFQLYRFGITALSQLDGNVRNISPLSQSGFHAICFNIESIFVSPVGLYVCVCVCNIIPRINRDYFSCTELTVFPRHCSLCFLALRIGESSTISLNVTSRKDCIKLLCVATRVRLWK